MRLAERWGGTAGARWAGPGPHRGAGRVRRGARGERRDGPSLIARPTIAADGVRCDGCHADAWDARGIKAGALTVELVRDVLAGGQRCRSPVQSGLLRRGGCHDDRPAADVLGVGCQLVCLRRAAGGAAQEGAAEWPRRTAHRARVHGVTAVLIGVRGL